MKIPSVIPDPIRNPGVKDWIPAYAGMTIYFHIKGEAGTEDILINALNEYGDLTMANRFFLCGNEQLSKAAISWADRYGYQIKQYGTLIPPVGPYGLPKVPKYKGPQWGVIKDIEKAVRKRAVDGRLSAGLVLDIAEIFGVSNEKVYDAAKKLGIKITY